MWIFVRRWMYLLLDISDTYLVSHIWRISAAALPHPAISSIISTAPMVSLKFVSYALCTLQKTLGDWRCVCSILRICDTYLEKSPIWYPAISPQSIVCLFSESLTHISIYHKYHISPISSEISEVPNLRLTQKMTHLNKITFQKTLTSCVISFDSLLPVWG